MRIAPWLGRAIICLAANTFTYSNGRRYRSGHHTREGEVCCSGCQEALNNETLAVVAPCETIVVSLASASVDEIIQDENSCG